MYTVVVEEFDTFIGPDGVAKTHAMLFNGSVLGPTIFANWGDRLNITVINRGQTNGTAIHWHGLHQNGTSTNDGVPGVTQCPIPPGSQMTYTYLIQQYGTTWFHSHFTAQYGNGVVGTMQFDGPASANYDIDLGVFPIMDWYYAGADDIVLEAMQGVTPPSDNVFFNGTNINPKNPAQGAYANVTFTPGKIHRIRLINPSAQNMYTVSIVGHSMTVIATDLVPTNPVPATAVFLGIGQRLDVLVNANQAVNNYWLNITFSSTGLCGSSLNPHPAAIVRYKGAPAALPTTPGVAPPDAETRCLDNMNLIPVLKRTAPVQSFLSTFNGSSRIDVQLDLLGPVPVVWKINGTSLRTDWGVPVTQSVVRNTPIVATNNIFIADGPRNSFTFWVIENQGGPNDTAKATLPHPIHLHGQDYMVIGKSTPSTPIFNASVAGQLNGNNPVRRDVSMLPTNGWMLIAFPLTNPGAWFIHCHIAWHVAGGLGWSFVELPKQIPGAIKRSDLNVFNEVCVEWNNYFPAHDPFPQDDSGLKIRGPSGITARHVMDGPLDAIKNLK